MGALGETSLLLISLVAFVSFRSSWHKHEVKRERQLAQHVVQHRRVLHLTGPEWVVEGRGAAAAAAAEGTTTRAFTIISALRRAMTVMRARCRVAFPRSLRGYSRTREQPLAGGHVIRARLVRSEPYFTRWHGTGGFTPTSFEHHAEVRCLFVLHSVSDSSSIWEAKRGDAWFKWWG